MSELKKLLEGVKMGWQSLATVANIYDGTHQTPKYVEMGVPFVSVQNIKNLYATNKYISLQDFEKYKYKPQRGDIFMTRIGSIGSCAIVENDNPLAYYVTLTLIRVNHDVINSKYLKHIIESTIGQRELLKRTLVNATPIKINLGEIGKIQIPIPCPDNPEKSLKIQQEIVRILDRLSEETKQLTAALQKELNIHHKNHNFYRERLMNFEDRELKWKTLEEVAEFQNGKGHEKVINPEGKYIVVNSKFISTNGSVAKHSNVQITPLYKNDILIVMSDLPNGRALARTFLVTENDKYTLNQRIGRLTIKNTDSLNPTFLCYFLNRNEHLLKYNNGIDQTNLQKKQILDAKIPTVSVSEQLSIVAKLNDLNLTTANLVSEIQKEITLRNKQYEYYRDRLLSFQSLQTISSSSLRAEGEAIQKNTTTQ